LLEAESHTTREASIKPGWSYHPNEPGLLVARAVLPNGSTVFSGQRGERWLVDARHVVDVAPDLAPEELVAIVPPRADQSGGAGRWLFVGKSGTTYESREALGAFVRASAPLDPLVRVREGGGVLMGLRRDGALARS